MSATPAVDVGELTPLPFADLLRRMVLEARRHERVFDLGKKKWWIPAPDDFDYSVRHFGRRASTPVGPAAGPHTQLAQNLVLSWLAGSRILELKTVQVNDRLEIPRPCIHAPNIGFNVEWSQELRIHQSIEEYAKAVYLIEILKKTRVFGLFPAGVESHFDTIYDISVGYDLEGIQSPPVDGFLDALKDPSEAFDRLRTQIPDDLAILDGPDGELDLRGLELPSCISDCVTLSTFHGCPADQIEAIARHLLEAKGLHTLIKLNPTLLGFETVREIVHDRLGYTHLELRQEAFDHDLQYDDGLAILRRLKSVAEAQGSTIGAKFTNTLVVASQDEIFPTQSDAYMYVSGPPLHVLAMTLMQRFRSDLAAGPDGFHMPVSFSAGIDSRNVAAAVACGLVPVTTCTDLMKAGGYGRLPSYMRSLKRAMEKVGATSRDAYVLAAHGHAGDAARLALQALTGNPEADIKGNGGGDQTVERLRETAVQLQLDGDALVLEATRIAGRLNGEHVVPPLLDDPRYGHAKNSRTPKRVDLKLELYDCINCDLCITACPNDAVFAYTVQPVERPGFVLKEAHQLGILEDACNQCSNCEVYCPEDGAPFQIKERVFRDRDLFLASEADGFCYFDGALHGRVDGEAARFVWDGDDGSGTLEGDGFFFRLDGETVTDAQVSRAHSEGRDHGIDAAALDRFKAAWRFKTVWDSIVFTSEINMINVSTLGGISR